MAPGLANARPTGNANFANAPPPGLTRRTNAPISPGLGVGDWAQLELADPCIKQNLENFQVHLLDELNFEFSFIGVSETKIISGKEMDFNPSIPGYVFEYVPTPLASHIDNFVV